MPEKSEIIKLSAYLVIISYAVCFICIGIAIAKSPWFSFPYNWLSELGNSSEGNTPVVDGILVCHVFNAGLMLGGLGGMAFSYGMYLSNIFKGKKGMLAIALFFLAMVFIFLTGFFSQDYGILHTISAFSFFFLVPLSLLAISLSTPGWTKLTLRIVSVASLLAFVLLFVDRPWGSNSIVEFVPAIALGVGIILIVRMILSPNSPSATQTASQDRESN